MNASNKQEALQQAFLTSPLFHVMKVSKRCLVVTRRRSFIPGRGVLRLLIPHTNVIIIPNTDRKPTILVCPDPIAIFMVMMILGGVLVEFFMDRSLHHRSYPPALIYGLAFCYIGLLLIEMFATQAQLRRLLGQTKS